jgi:hypothetical protein
MPNTRSLLAVLLAAGCLVAPVAWTAAQTTPPSPAPKTDEPAEITPLRQRSIEHGIRWLKSGIRANGMVGPDIGHAPDLSCTAMTGLALLAHGSTPHGGEHSKEVSRVLEAVLTMSKRLPPADQERQESTNIRRKIGAYADRFLAALFLSEILGESGDAEDDVRQTLEKLVNDICEAQRDDGMWGSDSWAPVLGTVLGWESLRSSSSGGMQVSASANRVGEALLKLLRKEQNRREGWMHDFYKKASSIRVLYSMNYREDPVFQDCLQHTLKLAKTDRRPFVEAGGEEYLAFFLVTECLMHDPEGLGKEWYPVVADRLIEVQNADGSWTGHHCIHSRTFCTAAALMTLQAPNLCLAISNQ